MTVRDYARARRRRRARPLGRRSSTSRAPSSPTPSSSRCARASRSTSTGSMPSVEPGRRAARARGARAVRGALRRARLRAADDEHGARRRRVRDRARRHGLRRVHGLPSLEIAGPGGHWVEVSRAPRRRRAPRCSGCSRPTRSTTRPRRRRSARARPRTTCTARSRPGFTRPRLPPRPRDRPLDRDDDDRVSRRSARAIETELATNMVFSMHPHAIAADGRECLYMQDTWLVTADGGVPLARTADADLVSAPNADEFQPILPGEGASDYERYLRTDELLALQKGPDEWVHRDELLFQTVHQSSELWLKHAWTEVEEATRLIEARDLAGALRLLRRANHADPLRHLVPRAPRADVAVGVPGGAPRARPRLAASTRPASARSGRSRPASTPRSTRCGASAGCRCSRSTPRAASTRTCTSWPRR